MCSHDGCGVVVSYHESISHQNACPHGRCTCTEPGCDFAAPPSALVVHLAEAHSIQVHMIEYGMSREFRVTMTRPGSPFRRIVIQGEDGSVFVLNISVHGSATVVSLVRVSVRTSDWPYRVKMWARGPPPSSKADCKRDVVRVAADASSSVLPGAIAFEELTSFLVVPGPYLVGAGSSKQLRLYIRICKQM